MSSFFTRSIAIAALVIGVAGSLPAIAADDSRQSSQAATGANTLATGEPQGKKVAAPSGPKEDILDPWEKFCLLNADPGEDLDRCLDGLP